MTTVLADQLCPLEVQLTEMALSCSPVYSGACSLEDLVIPNNTIANNTVFSLNIAMCGPPPFQPETRVAFVPDSGTSTAT